MTGEVRRWFFAFCGSVGLSSTVLAAGCRTPEPVIATTPSVGGVSAVRPDRSGQPSSGVATAVVDARSDLLERIVAEPGCEAVVELVLEHLEWAERTVEETFALAFDHPVRIDVYATRESYRRGTLGPIDGRASAFPRLVALSGKLGDAAEIETTPAILVHELTHSLFLQHMGALRYRAQLPKWFQEGVAVMASIDGGAEGVSRADAAVAILAGETFEPESTGTFFRLPYSAPDGLPVRMFYRQAGLFVEFLRERDPVRFRGFVHALDSVPFEEAFAKAFDGDVPTLWGAFGATLAQRSDREER